jgi:phosphoribosyl-ATP pyrophosphohydrolase/phosphoribosyl-AMP cyclohydrolase
MNEDIFKKVKWNAEELIPAVIQDFQTGQVLMVAYMNEVSLRQTLESGETVFWSRSRKALWKKGETSGNIQKVREIRIDCDEDTLLIKVDQKNGACHTGHLSCFYRKWEDARLFESVEEGHSSPPASAHLLDRLAQTILSRKENPSSNSYVSSLFLKGEDAILKKIAEEAGEVLLSSKGKKREEILWEVADLWFHTLVLLGFHGISLKEVFGELERREGKSGLRNQAKE